MTPERTPPSGQPTNLLLAALPAAERDRLRPVLEPVQLGLKESLYRIGEPVEHVYFPTAGVMSQVALLDEDVAIEVNTVGREGMVGLAAFLGVATSPDQVFCQIPGRALRLPVDQLRSHGAAGGPLHQLLNLYTQVTLVQLARSAACNQFHTVAERMSRWLLMTHDRADHDSFPLTQEFLAQMLGVRRATVSLTAATLQNAGMISYTRGRITIRQRAVLEETSCDCYRAIRDQYDRLLPPPARTD